MRKRHHSRPNQDIFQEKSRPLARQNQGKSRQNQEEKNLLVLLQDLLIKRTPLGYMHRHGANQDLLQDRIKEDQEEKTLLVLLQDLLIKRTPLGYMHRHGARCQDQGRLPAFSQDGKNGCPSRVKNANGDKVSSRRETQRAGAPAQENAVSALRGAATARLPPANLRARESPELGASQQAGAGSEPAPVVKSAVSARAGPAGSAGAAAARCNAAGFYTARVGGS